MFPVETLLNDGLNECQTAETVFASAIANDLIADFRQDYRVVQLSVISQSEKNTCSFSTCSLKLAHLTVQFASLFL